MSDSSLASWMQDDDPREAGSARATGGGAWGVEDDWDEQTWGSDTGTRPCPDGADTAWPDAAPSEPPARTRTHRVWVMAAAPWAVAAAAGAALVLGGPEGTAEPNPAVAESPAAGETDPGDQALPSGEAAPGSQPASVQSPTAAPSTGRPLDRHGPAGPMAPAFPEPGATGSQVPADLAAAAAVTVRMALTTDAQPTARYVDLVVAESVDHRDGEVAVVTVRVVLLEGARGRWDSVRSARYAVPLSITDLQPLGGPWALSVPAVEDPAPLTVEPLEEPERAAVLTSTAEAAGYREVSIEGLVTAAPAGLTVVRLRGIAPGEQTEQTHDLWMDATGTRVLGDT
jgi:hypothetical protein